MKTKFLFILALAFGLALPGYSKILQVTTVGATASTIVTPGPHLHILTIQNNGSGDVRIGIDGGTTNGLVDPTSSTGYLLKAGTQLILTFPGTQPQLQVRAILVTGTTTVIDIVTDDAASK